MSNQTLYEVQLTKFFSEYRKPIEEILLAEDVSKDYSLDFHFHDLQNYDLNVALWYLNNPGKAVEIGDNIILELQEALKDELEQSGHDEIIYVKFKCHARLVGLFPRDTKRCISNIRSSNVGKLIQFEGTVTRTGACKMVEYKREYKCDACGETYEVTSDLSLGNVIEVPKRCTAQKQEDGKKAKKCGCKIFHYVENSRECRDFQEIRVQEQMNNLELGSIPKQLKVVMFDDLVDSCQAGDDAILVGEVCYMWQPLKKEERCDVDMFLKATSIKTRDAVETSKGAPSARHKEVFDAFWREHSKDPVMGRNQILANICPQLFGMSAVKLAVALTVIGGVATTANKVRVRGQSHLLLVGDPGCGKSQLLRYASKLTQRSVITTGIGTTSAGLTVAAVKDGRDWALEAGALVLADGGICCIDEFSTVRDADRAAIHEAMEQQTISVAKAGLVCTLNTRSTVFAAQNPKNGFDSSAGLDVNTGIASPLLSRFDIILLLLDEQNEKWDRDVATHIMNNLAVPGEDEMLSMTSQRKPPASPVPQPKRLLRPASPADLSEHAPEKSWSSEQRTGWDADTMAAYFSCVRSIIPKMTRNAEEMIVKFYTYCRHATAEATGATARTTVRLLESLIRLAQAHARLMYRDKVTSMDATCAIILVEHSMRTRLFNNSDNNVLHTKFKKQPDKKYLEQKEVLLETIGIFDLPYDPYDDWNYSLHDPLAQLFGLVDSDDELMDKDVDPSDDDDNAKNIMGENIHNTISTQRY